MYKKRNTFYCFSPLVMAVTFLIEIGLLTYTLFRYRLNPMARVVTATLFFLALFQLSEYTVCGASSMSANIWSRIGFISITMLPPLGIHLISQISGRIPRWVVASSYAIGLGFAIIFGFSQFAFQGHVCAGNYAIFQLMPNLGGAYFAYYYTLLIYGIFASLYFSIKSTTRVRQALIYQAAGHLNFLLTTGIVNVVNPQTIEGIPSIMCGFAVIYALVLVFGIVPLMLRKR